MLAFSVHQKFLGSIAANFDNAPLHTKIWIAKNIVLLIMLILFLCAWILSSEKSKKDWFKIVIGLLLLVWGIWATISSIREISN
jgi:protein-S-isoprenylcysteine O-methyltransferase Ste14